MVYKVFLDSDVLIDFLLDRKPHSEYSLQLLDYCEKGILESYTSVLCISNIHYIIRRVVGERKARKIIIELTDLVDIIGVSRQDIENALLSDFNDFEDAIQHSVVLQNKEIKSIITRNVKDYKNSKVSVISPDALVKIINDDIA
ncbi:MAG: PIN domain-containing protein [Bacteroidota bacterium]